MPHCPRCAARLVWKKILGGIYLGCPNYPECAKPMLMPPVTMPSRAEEAYSQIASVA